MSYSIFVGEVQRAFSIWKIAEEFMRRSGFFVTSISVSNVMDALVRLGMLLFGGGLSEATAGVRTIAAVAPDATSRFNPYMSDSATALKTVL